MKIEPDRLGDVTDLVGGEAWSAAELAAEVRRRGALLESRSLRRGSFAILAHGGTPSFFADLLAVWRLGACAVCLDPRLTHGELTNIVEFVEPTAILVGERSCPDTRGIAAPVIRASREPTGPARRARGAPDPMPDDPALMLFTSGTTGAPKGVVHSFRSLFARLALNRDHIGGETLARALCVLPTHFGHGLIGNCLTPLLAGGHLFLATETGVSGAASLGTAISDNRISFMSSVPAFWRLVLKVSRPPESPGLRRVQIGSAPLSADLWRGVMAWAGTDDVANMYGLTETANWTAGASAAGHAPADGLVGTMWGGRAAVRGGDGTIHDQGDGEIVLRSPSLMTGYHRRDDLTCEALRDGWYHTGDAGRIDGDGVIRLTGRFGEEINRAGLKVHPEEVDLLLQRHPEVVDACAFALPDEISGEIVGVAVRLVADSTITVAALRAWCAARIRREAVPERWFVVPRIPRSERGKTDRAAVRESCLGGGDRG